MHVSSCNVPRLSYITRGSVSTIKEKGRYRYVQKYMINDLWSCKIENQILKG